MQRNTAILEACTIRTRSLRDANPGVKASKSIFEASSDTESTFGGVASTVGASEFKFDDVIVNFQVYRRTLAAAHFRNFPRSGEQLEVEGDLIDLSGPSAKEKEDEDTLMADLRSLSFSAGNEKDGPYTSLQNNAAKRSLVELQLFHPSGNTHTGSLNTKVEEFLPDNSKRLDYLNLGVEEQSEVNVKGLEYLDLEDLVHGHTRLSQSANRSTTLSASLPRSSDRELAATPREIPLGQNSVVAPSNQSISAEDLEILMAQPKEWHDFWDTTIDSAIFERINKAEITRRYELWEIFQTEMFYMRQLEVWLKLYHDQLLARWPPIVENAQEFTHNVFRHIEEIKAINTEYLFHPLRFRYLDQGP